MGKPEQGMLSAPVVDLEQRDKNNKKKATRNNFGGPGGPPANSIFTASLGKQTVKSSAGTPTKDPREKLATAGDCQLHKERDEISCIRQKQPQKRAKKKQRGASCNLQ